MVGAGASAECGLPAGDDLKQTIAGILGSLTSSKDIGLRHLVSTAFGQDTANELSTVIPTFPSMDEALHYLRDREKTVLLGKAAIVDQILVAERNSRLITPGNHLRANVDALEGTWMPNFLSMALSAVTMSDIGVAFQNVTIINFNYDRTFEHYMYAALQSKALLSPERAHSVIQNIRVIRPYGWLGGLEWSGNPKVSFGGLYADADISALAGQIRTYTEQAEQGLQDQIQAVIEPAALVIFLGFGFHQQNLTLIKDRAPSARRHKHIFGTVYGINEHNYQALGGRLSRNLQTGFVPQLLDMRAAELLVKLRPSIMLAD